MIDAIGTEQFDGVTHTLGATGLARMHGAAQTRRAGTSERFCEARAGATGGRLVTVDRERDDARVSQGCQRVEQFGRGVRRLRAQQADTQAHGRKPVLFCRGQAGIDCVDHVGQTTVPGRPVGRVDDHVRVACTAVAERLL